MLRWISRHFVSYRCVAADPEVWIFGRREIACLSSRNLLSSLSRDNGERHHSKIMFAMRSKQHVAIMSKLHNHNYTFPYQSLPTAPSPLFPALPVPYSTACLHIFPTTIMMSHKSHSSDPSRVLNLPLGPIVSFGPSSSLPKLYSHAAHPLPRGGTTNPRGCGTLSFGAP